jgi:hypothetical protein
MAIDPYESHKNIVDPLIIIFFNFFYGEISVSCSVIKYELCS